MTAAGPPGSTLYGKPGCHLCDDARAVVAGSAPSSARSTPRSTSPRDADLPRRFGEEIPVTFVDGEQHDFWRVDDARLTRALRG